MTGQERDAETLRGLSRRSFLASGLTAGAAVGASMLFVPGFYAEAHKVVEPFTLPDLPYDPEALEPIIDVKTMQIHHGKHHAGLCSQTQRRPRRARRFAGDDTEGSVGGGSVKGSRFGASEGHQLGRRPHQSLSFLRVLGPKDKVSKPEGALADAINAGFGSLDKLQERLIEAGSRRFGSGWAWLVKTSDGKLDVYSTANQDSPVMKGDHPIFGIDVWEHAYYLNYQNRRGAYLKAIFDIVNWQEVAKEFAS